MKTVDNEMIIFKTKYVLDCEFVQNNYGALYPKELAIVDMKNPLDIKHLIMNTKGFVYTKQNMFLCTQFHKIPLSLGNNTIADLKAYVKDNSLIYVQGSEKRDIIQYYLPNCLVINLNLSSITKQEWPYKQISVTCPFVHSSVHCLFIKVLKLYNAIITHSLS